MSVRSVFPCCSAVTQAGSHSYLSKWLLIRLLSPIWRLWGRLETMAGMPLFAHAGRERFTPPPLSSSAPLKRIKFCGALEPINKFR